ncbi:MAG: hypothetical protein ACRBK7_25885 [Acidimicrobiales bacterium]
MTVSIVDYLIVGISEAFRLSKPYMTGYVDAGSRVHVAGTISSAAFASGDRFVVGHWPESPIGPMGDVMWADPQGCRTLLAPTAAIADFITRIYDFDEVRVESVNVRSDGRTTTANGQALDLQLVGGRRWPIPIRRPLAITRFIEAPIARTTMGVRTFGTSQKGAREWYQSNGWRWVSTGSASLEGRDLGPLVPFDDPMGVGFSEPPRRPSIVGVRVTIDLPDTDLPDTDL